MRTIMFMTIAVLLLAAVSAGAVETITLARAADMGLVRLVSLGGYLGGTVQVIVIADPDEEMLLQVKRGDVLLNKEASDQNLVVTRDADIPLNPGTATEAIWTLCLDWDKGSPKEGEILDVAPPLSEWRNEHVDLLIRLLEQIDKLEVWADRYAQDAVWSITDNKWIVDSIILRGLASKLLHAAKIKLNVYRVFPHLSDPLSDEAETGFAVPPELILNTDAEAR